MGDLRLEELSAKTIVAANNLTLRPGQEQFVTPVSYSAADAYLNPTTTWARVVLDGDEVVGFIRGNFDPDHEKPEFRSCISQNRLARTEERTTRAAFSRGLSLDMNDPSFCSCESHPTTAAPGWAARPEKKKKIARVNKQNGQQ